MKKVFWLMALWIFVSVSALAQEREISGILIDGDTKEPAYQATVRLLKTDSALVTGAISDDRGAFKMNAPSDGDFVIKVTIFRCIQRLFQIQGMIWHWD